MKRSLFLPAWASALALLLMVFAVPALHADEDAPTVQQCRDAFMQSPAASSCGADLLFAPYVQVNVTHDGFCGISAPCSMDSGGSWDSSITATLSDTKKLENCNGRLRNTGGAGCPE